eukprot:763369-Hanusia_phi.AAC.2
MATIGNLILFGVILPLLGLSCTSAHATDDIASPLVGMISEGEVTITPGFSENGRRISHSFGERGGRFIYEGAHGVGSAR